MVVTDGSGFAPGEFVATKYIETGCFVECWQFEDAPYSYVDDVLFADSLAGTVPVYEDEDGTHQSEQLALEFQKRDTARQFYDATKRRLAHYQAQRHEIRRIIECNQTEDPRRTKFYTLTFAERNEKTVDAGWCNRQLGNHFKRLKRYLAKVEPEVELRYLACIERQKRQVQHYHVVLFDFPFVAADKLAELWGWGFIQIKSLRTLDAYENAGLYISKYFTKDLDQDKGKKKFWTSRNLRRPKVLKTVAKVADFDGCEVALSYEYDRWVRDAETGEYRVSKVRYTRIRNDGRGMGAFIEHDKFNDGAGKRWKEG